MPKDDAGPAVRLDGLPETTALSAPVLAVGLGRRIVRQVHRAR